jgi:hypothetical protein
MSTYGTHIQCDTINGRSVASFQDAQDLESVLATGNNANLKDINQVGTLRAVNIELTAKVDTVKMETEILEVEDENGNSIIEASFSLANSESDVYLYSLPTQAPSGGGVSVPFKVWSNGGLLQLGDAIPTSDPGIGGRIWCDPGANFVLKVSQTAAPGA